MLLSDAAMRHIRKLVARQLGSGLARCGRRRYPSVLTAEIDMKDQAFLGKVVLPKHHLYVFRTGGRMLGRSEFRLLRAAVPSVGQHDPEPEREASERVHQC